MENYDLKKEARILSLVTDYIIQGKIKPTERQIEMIISLNDELYRNYAKNGKKLENNDIGKEPGE